MILAEGTKEVPGYRLLLPDVPEIVWTLIFLGIFIAVFMRYILPKLNAVLDERSEKIQGGLDRAERMQEEVDRLRAEQEHELAEARKEAATIREKARTDGSQIVEDAKATAESEAARMLASARQQIEAERQNAAAQLRGQVGLLASDLAGKIVGESLTDDDRANRVIDRFLADLDENAASHR